MRIITFSTLYPNPSRPGHGVFVETRLRHLVESGRVAARVVAPVAWFPSANQRFGRYAAFALAPLEELRHGIPVIHPRYLSVPKIGMNVAPLLLAAGARASMITLLRRDYDFDLIDAHYFYPDGVAAAIIGASLNKPVVITARGSDVNLLPQFAVPRRMILWAARRAAAVVTVSEALKKVLTRLGVDGGKVSVLRNGVDTRLFCPVDRAAARAQLNLSGTVFLCVGNLVANKGHDLVIEALRSFPDACLLVIGEGSEERKLKQLTRELGVAERVRFTGAMAQEQLVTYYGAADVLVLASSREGWPNVLLEAMACGTPVVSSDVGGTPEIVAAPEAGLLMAERSVQGVTKALRKLMRNYPNRSLTRRHAERFGWGETTQGQIDLFSRVIGVRGGSICQAEGGA